MSHEKRLEALGISLPPPKKPAYAYVPVVVDGGLAWVSGQLPWDGEQLVAQGKLGAEIDIETGKRCARACVLNGLAVVREALGSLDRVARVVKVLGFVASGPGFGQQAAVVDGASGLFADVFGEAGRHARSAIGVAELPRNAPVEVEFVVALRAGG